MSNGEKFFEARVELSGPRSCLKRRVAMTAAFVAAVAVGFSISYALTFGAYSAVNPDCRGGSFAIFYFWWHCAVELPR